MQVLVEAGHVIALGCRPGVTWGLHGAQPNGLHINEDLKAPLTAATTRPPPAAIEQEELEAAEHQHHLHQTISTPSLIADQWKRS